MNLINRRSWIKSVGIALPYLTQLSGYSLSAAFTRKQRHADLVIIGGGFGGCAAALSALRQGLRVIMTEETDWVGGQVTAQAVPPDEHPWIEQFGSTALYRLYRQQVREYYRQHYPLTETARMDGQLNPGNGWVSKICHEPRVSLAVLTQFLAPYLSSGQLSLLLNHIPVSAQIHADKITEVVVRSIDGAGEIGLKAPYFIDATEKGDLLPITGTEYVIGSESQKQTGEPHAPPTADPKNQQAFTCCFAIEYLNEGDYTIEKPDEYDFWRSYQPELRPSWTGRLLSWRSPEPKSLQPRDLIFDPTEKATGLNLWTYRRIADPAKFQKGAYPSGICLVNWPQNDYWLGPIIDVPAEDALKHIKRAKQLSLSLLYWMQTEAPRPDGKTGWKGLRLREDITGTVDGLAKYPYIRESRRIRAEYTICEQDIATDARIQETGQPLSSVKAKPYADTIGIGHYRIDLHPSTGGDNYIDTGCLPFQIPLGAMIPQRMQNLLPVSKNIGTTHITNGCYRLHPVEWGIGEAVGYLIAFCLREKKTPREVRNQGTLLNRYQNLLRQQKVELEWPQIRPL